MTNGEGSETTPVKIDYKEIRPSIPPQELIALVDKKTEENNKLVEKENVKRLHPFIENAGADMEKNFVDDVVLEGRSLTLERTVAILSHIRDITCLEDALNAPAVEPKPKEGKEITTPYTPEQLAQYKDYFFEQALGDLKPRKDILAQARDLIDEEKAFATQGQSQREQKKAVLEKDKDGFRTKLDIWRSQRRREITTQQESEIATKKKGLEEQLAQKEQQLATTPSTETDQDKERLQTLKAEKAKKRKQKETELSQKSLRSLKEEELTSAKQEFDTETQARKQELVGDVKRIEEQIAALQTSIDQTPKTEVDETVDKLEELKRDKQQRRLEEQAKLNQLNHPQLQERVLAEASEDFQTQTEKGKQDLERKVDEIKKEIAHLHEHLSTNPNDSEAKSKLQALQGSPDTAEQRRLLEKDIEELKNRHGTTTNRGEKEKILKRIPVLENRLEKIPPQGELEKAQTALTNYSQEREKKWGGLKIDLERSSEDNLRARIMKRVDGKLDEEFGEIKTLEATIASSPETSRRQELTSQLLQLQGSPEASQQRKDLQEKIDKLLDRKQINIEATQRTLARFEIGHGYKENFPRIEQDVIAERNKQVTNLKAQLDTTPQGELEKAQSALTGYEQEREGKWITLKAGIEGEYSEDKLRPKIMRRTDRALNEEFGEIAQLEEKLKETPLTPKQQLENEIITLHKEIDSLKVDHKVVEERLKQEEDQKVDQARRQFARRQVEIEQLPEDELEKKRKSLDLKWRELWINADTSEGGKESATGSSIDVFEKQIRSYDEILTEKRKEIELPKLPEDLESKSLDELTELTAQRVAHLVNIGLSFRSVQNLFVELAHSKYQRSVFETDAQLNLALYRTMAKIEPVRQIIDQVNQIGSVANSKVEQQGIAKARETVQQKLADFYTRENIKKVITSNFGGSSYTGEQIE
ncbi:hypothetical protein A2Z22_02055 [Candidatus Woesebacteria bacterium RBG_16_34_12]|uniref:Uncharacterized protein n=1 Tax=Candidatus Woesebacteria bacterium RBG_16_34_12 TaxID=1802480 RepID=A0A1F7X949_9BACT|nr:MAG: hypothetical protein A2Z22_02055 [Candidatus Woesebacteria bacterium RBG_16_34_12]